MQAIKTRYYPPTNFKGARMRAGCAAKFIFVPYDYGLDMPENHRVACEELRKRLKWTIADNRSPMIGGDYAGDYYWIFASDIVTTI